MKTKYPITLNLFYINIVVFIILIICIWLNYFRNKNNHQENKNTNFDSLQHIIDSTAFVNFKLQQQIDYQQKKADSLLNKIQLNEKKINNIKTNYDRQNYFVPYFTVTMLDSFFAERYNYQQKRFNSLFAQKSSPTSSK